MESSDGLLLSAVERKAYELDPSRWVDAPRGVEFVLVDPQNDLEIDTQSSLGAGGFGRVLKALFKRGGGSTGAHEHVTVAVKMLFASTKVTDDLLKSFYVEAYQLSPLVHPNVVHLHGACCRPPHLCLVQELAELGRCAASQALAPPRPPTRPPPRRSHRGQAPPRRSGTRRSGCCDPLRPTPAARHGSWDAASPQWCSLYCSRCPGPHPHLASPLTRLPACAHLYTAWTRCWPARRWRG